MNKNTINIITEYTIEEIHAILMCDSTDREGIIKDLADFLSLAAPDVAEIIHSTIDKLHALTEDEFEALSDMLTEY